MNTPHAKVETSFRLDSLEPVADPFGGSETWFRYVISQGGNSENVITGTRCGSPLEINRQLQEMVARLNERCGKLAKKNK